MAADGATGPTVTSDGAGTSDAAEHLRSYVRHASMPLLLMELPGGSTVEVSDSFVEFFGTDRAACLAGPVVEYTNEPDRVRLALALVGDGVIDGYSRRASTTRPGGKVVEFGLRVHAGSQDGPRTLAVATVLPDDLRTGDGATIEGADLEGCVLGTVDSEGVIQRLGSDGAELLPLPADQMVGRNLLEALHPGDAGGVLLLAATSVGRSAGVTGRVRVQPGDGSWIFGQLALHPLVGQPTGFAFALSASSSPTAHLRTDGPDPREIETMALRNDRHLWAAAAATWLPGLPTVAQLPALGLLTDREHEIVVRLAGGQRVSTIARELFLSPSTVRNHLTGVYRKFGVASQTELIELIERVRRP